MISEPNANTSLSFEQLAQIEEAKRRLSNIESEIAIASKNLAVVNKDVVKSTKEREYQEGLSASLAVEVADKKREALRLEAAATAAREALDAAEERLRETERRIAAMIADAEDSEKAIAHREKKVLEREQEAEREASRFSAERAEVERAREAFLDAARHITWKSSREP